MMPPRTRAGYAAGTGLVRFALIVLVLTACGRDNPTDSTPGPSRSWTLLLYDDADFFNAYDPLEDFGREVWSGDDVAILVLADAEDGPAVLGHIDSEHLPLKLQEMGEVNMGDPATLTDFLQYAVEHYPAQRYILAFYDHGGGWQGTCWDDTNGHDNLTMDEIRTSLATVGGVDLVLFSAPCLMGSVEAAYELRQGTEVYIGSENLSGYSLWSETMGDICRTLHSDPGISNLDLGELIIDSIRQHAGEPTPVTGMTMSAVRTDRLSALAEAVEAVSLAYLSRIDSFRAHIDAVYQDVTRFYGVFADLWDLARQLRLVEQDPAVRDTLGLMQSCLEASIVAECHGTDWTDAHGLTLFLPDSTAVVQGALLAYTSDWYALDFVRDTHWDELWEVLYAANATLEGGFARQYPPGVSGLDIPPEMTKKRP